jgi:molybdopterin-guanine dinucleotide biosynthesis protein
MTPFSQLLQRIAEAGIDFVIVGGFAAVLDFLSSRFSAAVSG